MSASTAVTSIAGLNAEIAALLRQPNLVRRVEGVRWEASPGSAKDFRSHIADERTRWDPVIRRSGAQLD